MRSRQFLRMRREVVGFAVGSLFFFLGPWPWYADAVGVVAANATFFVGSLFFTTAATLQLLLDGRRPPRHAASRGDVLDWWSAAVQLGGTLLFNVSTAVALVAAMRDPAEVGAGWTSDAWGSLAFLVSSGLALGALRRRHELWDVFARTPGAVWLNVAGSVAFAGSAVGAFVVPSTDELLSLWWVNAGTIVGAACFFVAAVVSRPAMTLEGARSGS
ncbi:hypothetical protein [Demequina sp. NBRC 110056]|uniref:hypothetical protein n=1 Tax=Demequina sp. NBRC 110056 TaxID=1570345 RepID=UPI000A015400|nr:hypothetical protein [Demequina sp. NBRC 110056]